MHSSTGRDVASPPSDALPAAQTLPDAQTLPGAQTLPATDALSRAARGCRLAVAAVVAVLTLCGTLVGSDVDFPFGPFRMYATRDDPNGVVRIVAVRTVTVDGLGHDVTNARGAPRRAELEGRMSTLRADCAQFALLVPRYHPAADVRTVQLVEHDYQLHNGRRASRTDDVVCSVPWTSR